MRLLMYVLAVAVVLGIAMLCLRSCGPVPMAPAPQATEPTQTLTVPVLPAEPAVLPEPPPSLVTNVAGAPPVADAMLVTLEIVLSGQRGIPYEGPVHVRTFDRSENAAGTFQTKQLKGASSLSFSNLPATECSIAARLKRYSVAATNLSLEDAAGTLVTVVLALEPARSLRGTVVDATTKAPIGYAGVALLANATTSIVCDANGVFKFDEVQDEMAMLKAWHENYPTQQFSIFVPPAGATDVVLALMRAARIFGYVHDEYGLAVTGCVVGCYDVRRDMLKITQERVTSATDAGGFFDFPRVMPGERMRVDARDAARFSAVELALRPGEEREVLLVVSNPPPRPPTSNGWIHIIARDTAGAPVTKGKLVLTDNGFSMLDQGFDAQGECVFAENVGTLDIMLMGTGKPPLVTMAGIVVRYHETTTVHAVVGTLIPPILGEVRRANGIPAVGIVLRAEVEGKRSGITFAGQSDWQGEFTIPMDRIDLRYKLTSQQVEIDQPRAPVKPGDFVHVVLKPYSVIQLQTVASNSLEQVRILSCTIARDAQTSAESRNVPLTYEQSVYRLFLSSSGAYLLTIKAAGYKPVTLQRTFLPDEDVQLGTVYFEKEAPE
jgi:hypothetical protein